MDANDERIDQLWLAIGLLQSRLEAVDYMTAEMVAARFIGLTEEEMNREALTLAQKIKTWQPIFRGPMSVEELEHRRAELQGYAAGFITRAVSRAHQTALERGAEAAKRGRGEG